MAAIKAAVTEELLGLVKDEAVFEARQALEQEFTDRQERLLDDLEAQRRQIEKDAAAVADAEAAAQLKLDEETFAERLDDLRTRLRDWRARAETAEGLCLSLIRQLVGGVDGTPIYLRSITGEGVTELDRYAVNAILARAGLVLKLKATASARVVQTVLEPGKVHAHSLFWLTKAPVPGVVDADDTDAAEAL